MIRERAIQDARDVSIYEVFTDLYPNNRIKKSGSDYKAICPFHNDHTPSLLISTKRNRVHCFSCGTDMDVIDLVRHKEDITFDRAVRYIYENYIPHVKVESIYEECSAEEKKRYHRYETQLRYMRIAHNFYISNFNDSSEDAISCRQYAEYDEKTGIGRWNKDFCKSQRLGFARKRFNDFVTLARKERLDLKELEELGLISQYTDKRTGRQEYRDFFTNRLMIPITDAYGQTVGFAARTLDDSLEPKYLFNKIGDENLIFKKGSTVYGYHDAIQKMRETYKAYLVEGAPDALKLHSLGITNTVACLGSHWTEQQLAKLKGKGLTLCFIPDADENTNIVNGIPIKRGEAFVIENAMLALKEGFSVLIKEIPTDGTHKEDVDSYVKDMDVWDSLQEEEFVNWYAAKFYRDNFTSNEYSSFVNSVTDVIMQVKDEVLKDIYLNSMKELYPPATLWNSAQKRSESEIIKTRMKKAKKDSIVDHDKYGFFEKDNTYCSYDKQGHAVPLTNFKIIPLFHIYGEEYSSRVMELVNFRDVRRLVEFKQGSITKQEKFKDETEALGNFRINATSTMYENIKGYVYDHMPTVIRIDTMGWNSVGNDGFFAFANGIVADGTWLPVDEYGLVDYRDSRYFIPAYSQLYSRRKKAFKNMKRYAHIVKKPVTLYDFMIQVEKVWGMNGIVSLMYCFASLNKDIIVDNVDFFPILFFFGVMSSGKTQLATTMTRLFQIKEERNNLESTSSYVIGQRMQSLVNGVVNFDEYKNSLSKDKIDIFKGVYDYSGRSVKDDDNNERTQFDAESGVILTGQEIPDMDPALLSRTIFLEFYNRTRTEEELQEFHKIKEMRGYGVTAITIELLKYRKEFTRRWPKVWLDCLYEVKKREEVKGIDERIVECWTLSYATMKCYEECGAIFLTDRHKYLEFCINGMIHQQDVIVSTDEIATFWRYLQKGLLNGTVKERVHYKIVSLKKEMKVSRNRQHRTIYPEEHPTPLIYISMAACTEAINIQARREGKKLIGESSLRGYLENCPDFIGSMVASTYFNIMDDKGNYVKKIITDPKTKKEIEKSAYRPDRPLIFDYEAISKKYSVDFTKVYAVNNEPDEL